ALQLCPDLRAPRPQPFLERHSIPPPFSIIQESKPLPKGRRVRIVAHSPGTESRRRTAARSRRVRRPVGMLAVEPSIGERAPHALALVDGRPSVPICRLLSIGYRLSSI